MRQLPLALLASVCAAAPLDLTRAVVIHPPNFAGPEKKAVTMLLDEVEKRSQIRWRTGPASGSGPVIEVDRSGSGPAEGYRLQVNGRTVKVSGNDARGVLFGVGRLLRSMHLRPGSITIPDHLNVTTAPKYPLRGHQLGYRPKTNSYDGWTVAIWEQYIRDLVVFGANAVELIPPRSDDAADSPHFPLPPMDKMIAMSRLLDEYGLDVWIWYPAMDQDYSDPKTVEFALKEWAEVFQKLPRIDAVFVPGGDPGHTQPKHLMALLEKQTQSLRRYHPKAQMWVSPQSFDQAWMDEFYAILRTEPAWLAGVVFGPQVRVSLPQLRAAVPQRYPIRHYPDITHSRQCQYPVPDWDPAFAITQAREVINPRPHGQARIFRLLQPYTNGFLTYSEGCNDDVNKTVWSALGWNPDADVTEVLREYSRYYLGDRYADDFAQGLLALERNWRGPLLTNTSVYLTLEQFQSMERAASPSDLLNWRFQQALYRAYYDGYVAGRLLYENWAERMAMDRLRSAPKTGSLAALGEAESFLDRAVADRDADPRRTRVFELAEALFQSIRMQLSVERYKAIAVGRGANLDTVDMPLNNRLWLKQRFGEIRQIGDESGRLKAIGEIVNWTNPGPGGFYDDLGQPGRQPHLVRGAGFDQDPAFLESSLVSFYYNPALPISWWTVAESLNDAPLKMRYTDLDRTAQYRLKVVYAGEPSRWRINLMADDSLQIHDFMPKPFPPRPLEFDLPAQATADGELNLAWRREPGAGGNGRGCQVAEVWLMKK
jgi:hypothetical protein